MKNNYPAYVGFGMLTPVAIMVVGQLPEHNTGALVKEVSEFVFDDAAIIACLLRQWELPTAMIGTTVGDDPRGHLLAQQLETWGVQGEVRHSSEIRTPWEVDVSDETGARTYFWERAPQVLNTLDTANLAPLEGAGILYVDWYDGDHILRAMDEAKRLHVPVFLNFEHGHADPALLNRYAGRAMICQAVTDAAQLGEVPPLEIAQKLLKTGVQIALITMAGEGCLVVNAAEAVRVRAPSVHAVDGCGAGATFSAGFIYGYLKGWSLQESACFATAAASLKVTRPGLQMFPINEIKTLAAQLLVEYPAAADQPGH
ncbi:MAG: carbohydrate kinase family protein [Anaerolineales bacterium]